MTLTRPARAAGATRGHTWKHAMKKAGEGPAAFAELRATVPHRA